MAASAIDLTTSGALAADLGIAADATTQRAVTAASRAIASHCCRTLERAAGVVEYPPGFGRPYLVLARPPIISIVSIVEFGATVEAADYECVDENVEAGLV